MCAIAGIVNLDNCPIDVNLLRRMNDQLRHRGRDDEGYLLVSPGPRSSSWAEYSGEDSPRFIRDSYPPLRPSSTHHPFTIGLAHRRFSILDPGTTGHQPFLDADRTCCGAFNGEIFNYIEVRHELIRRGHCFRSASDIEVIIEAYKAWGTGCFSRFNGMWALALYDFKNKCLILSRDRLGEIPLYWTRIQNSVYFASEIKALLQVSPSFSVNEECIYPYLVHGLQHVKDETFFAGIFCLPAATWAVLDDKFPVTIHRYWRAPEQRFKEHEIPVHEATATIRDTLQDAVGMRLRADVPWCSTLSGGLDSSVLLTLAARCSSAPVEAFTVEFPDWQTEETSFARALARHCGAKLHAVNPPLQNFWHELLPFTYLAEEPYHAPNIYVRQLLCRAMQSEGFRVFLAGEGADELFAGYMRHFNLLQMENLLAYRFGTFMDNALRWSETRRNMKPLVRRFVHHVKPILQQLYLRFPGREFPDNSSKEKQSHAHLKLPHQVPTGGLSQQSLSTALYSEISNTSIPYWVRANDRMRMGVPMEGRSPFLDFRVVELAMTLPVTYLIRHGWQKWIVRKAFEKLLPQQVIWQKRKFGFPVPLRRFFASSPPTIQTLFRRLCNPYVDLRAYEVLAEHIARTEAGDWSSQIDRWRMTSFLLWYELFVNRNQELFSRIREEQHDGADHVKHKFAPQFLHSCNGAGLL